MSENYKINTDINRCHYVKTMAKESRLLRR